MTEDSASLARDREPAHPGTYLQATAGHNDIIPILFERDSSRSIPRNGAGAHSRFGNEGDDRFRSSSLGISLAKVLLSAQSQPR
jgi:hypothetical protein